METFPCYWPFVRGNHRSLVTSSYKGQWRGALIFSLICARINGWVNNREAGDLKCNHAHYDVTVMLKVTAYYRIAWLFSITQPMYVGPDFFPTGQKFHPPNNGRRHWNVHNCICTYMDRWIEGVRDSEWKKMIILMLCNRQAIFESKRDKLSSSDECRIRTLGVWYINSPADWMSIQKPTGYMCIPELHIYIVIRCE